MSQNSFPIQFSVRRAGGRQTCSAQESEFCVSRGFHLSVLLLTNTFHVGKREEAAQPVLRIDHEQLVCANVFGEKTIGAFDRIGAKLSVANGRCQRTRCHHFKNLSVCVSRPHDLTGEQAEEMPTFIHHRKGAEGEGFLLQIGEEFADGLVRRRFDGVGDQAVDIIFDAADL